MHNGPMYLELVNSGWKEDRAINHNGEKYAIMEK